MLLFDEVAELPELLERIRLGALDWRAIGQAARRRAEVSHTWMKRFADASQLTTDACCFLPVSVRRGRAVFVLVLRTNS